MAFSNLTRIILYVVAGISLLVVLFFYVSPRTLDIDALEARVDEIMNPVDLTPVAPLPSVSDSTAQDSTAVEQVSSAIVTTEVLNTSDINLKDELSGYEYLVWFRTDIALIWAYILVLLTLIASIIFPFIAILSNPKGLIRLLAVLAGAAVLVVIAYVLSKDTTIEIIGYSGTDNSDPATLKMIDTVLFVTYMLFGLALGSILYAIISKAFK
jgi:hypothetical protein